MGTLLTAKLQTFYEEDFNSGVGISQNFGKKIGSSVQFINNTHMIRLKFGAQGPYSTIVTIPALEHGLPEPVSFDSLISNVWLRSGTKGSSGTTEVDIKKQSIGSSTWTSIFSTTPKFTSTGADGDRIDSAGKIASLPTGVTRPVLDPTNSILSAGDILRFDIISVMVGAQDLSLDLDVKPR